jgi:hypothetical protein
MNGMQAIVAVNNDDNAATVTIPAACGEYKGMLSGNTVSANNGNLTVTIPAGSGEIWLCSSCKAEAVPVCQCAAAEKTNGETAAPPSTGKTVIFEEKAAEKPVQKSEEPKSKAEPETVKMQNVCTDKPYEEMTVEELQAAILAKMQKNGPVTDIMKKDVYNNIWKNSLINWVKSFR